MSIKISDIGFSKYHGNKYGNKQPNNQLNVHFNEHNQRKMKLTWSVNSDYHTLKYAIVENFQITMKFQMVRLE